MMSIAPLTEAQLEYIAENYRDLNGTAIEEWNRPPTALEFSRLVHISRPVVFRGGFNKQTLPALDLWTDDYLQAVMGDSKITVATTPNGMADALVTRPDGSTYFVEPHPDRMTMALLLRSLETSRAGLDSSETHTEEVCYLQSQNGNLFSADSEFAGINQDCPFDITWASEALDKHPEAVNLWIGNSQSTTSVHSDPYENIYAVVRGKKHFILLPPSEGWCLHESTYPHATYQRLRPGSLLTVVPTVPQQLVRWASLDPACDDLGPYAHPLRVTVEAGDILYLPAGWWHHVTQSGEAADPVVIAVNWWYDMEMRGSSWQWMSLLRDLPRVGDESDDDA